MNATIPESLLRQFSAFLVTRAGLHFPPARWPDLLRGMENAAAEFGFPGVEPCLRWLIASVPERRQVEILASHLTVGETYFFRDPAVFAALENDILPPLIAARRACGRSLRIWCAACCTGEEPYSLAILLGRLIPDAEHWNISIRGTDINPLFLAKAAHGVYREWSFRGVPEWIRGSCFELTDGGGYRLAARYRKLVTFDYLNLADDVYPAVTNSTNAMDIVLCRNVLMYFDAPAVAAVARKLAGAVVDGGWLIVSPSEASASLFPDFTPVRFGDAVFFRKDGHHTPVRPHCRPESATVAVSPAGAAPATAPAALSEARAAGADAAPGTSPPAFYRSALACFERGDYEGTRAALVEAGGADRRAFALLARSCANLGRLDEARHWCEAAVAADKTDPGLRYLLASVLEEAGCAEEAIAVLRQALYLDQDYILAHFALGNLYRRRDDPARAAKHFAHARQLLRALPADAPLADAGGLSAGRLREIIDTTECIA